MVQAIERTNSFNTMQQAATPRHPPAGNERAATAAPRQRNFNAKSQRAVARQKHGGAFLPPSSGKVMVMIRSASSSSACLCVAPAAIAQSSPDFAATPVIQKPADPRIRVIDYDPDQIYSVTGHTGYQMTIEFEPDEKIETVGIGDSSGWQVTPNGNATLLFLKPTAVAARYQHGIGDQQTAL